MWETPAEDRFAGGKSKKRRGLILSMGKDFNCYGKIDKASGSLKGAERGES